MKLLKQHCYLYAGLKSLDHKMHDLRLMVVFQLIKIKHFYIENSEKLPELY